MLSIVQSHFLADKIKETHILNILGFGKYLSYSFEILKAKITRHYGKGF